MLADAGSGASCQSPLRWMVIGWVVLLVAGRPRSGVAASDVGWDPDFAMGLLQLCGTVYATGESLQPEVYAPNWLLNPADPAHQKAARYIRVYAKDGSAELSRRLIPAD